ncbi:chromobox protein, putative [Pediculus humanus corporis]|uniref:Chromobox protein, putative n=1 Tax=Pediculus humanus subsp. corporis TaxID=121224 RepID=E0VYK4_PEDHC|nr:chromobox protein, putative [Pediculus humanus corporis]EEB18460.1 chromobox protein, putative [Pediculus humanus corporis]
MTSIIVISMHDIKPDENKEDSMGKNVIESKLTTREEKTKNTNRRELRKRISKMPPEMDKLTNVKKSKKLKNEKNIRVRNVKNKKIGKGKMEEEKKDTSENVEKESSLPASPSSSEEEEEEDESNLKEYEVEKLIDIYMKKNNERKFLVRWKGYSSKHDTWEPEKHLNCKELINAFLKKLDKKDKPPSSVRNSKRKIIKPNVIQFGNVNTKKSSRLKRMPRLSYYEPE